jgi:hypothetical protein
MAIHLDLEYRFEKVYSMMVKLQDYVSFTAEGCHKKKSEEDLLSVLSTP